MLVDPWGNRTISCPSPDPADKGKMADVLVEIAPPVESSGEGYSVNGIFVTDFVTPAYYDVLGGKGTQYDFTGSVKKPLSVLKVDIFLGECQRASGTKQLGSMAIHPKSEIWVN